MDIVSLLVLTLSLHQIVVEAEMNALLRGLLDNVEIHQAGIDLV